VSEKPPNATHWSGLSMAAAMAIYRRPQVLRLDEGCRCDVDSERRALDALEAVNARYQALDSEDRGAMQ
jgi:hypothetical protein